MVRSGWSHVPGFNHRVLMKDFIIVGLALFAGMGAFAVIYRKYGSDCIP